jgi:hypothetical protein
MEQLIHNWLPSLIACGALSLVWAGFQSSKKSMESSVKKLEEFISQIQKEMRLALYDADSGITRYVPRADCDRQTGACQRAICSKLDSLDKFLRASDADILKQMVRMDDKREKTKENLRRDFELLKSSVDNLTGKFEQREVDRRNGKV